MTDKPTDALTLADLMTENSQNTVMEDAQIKTAPPTIELQQMVESLTKEIQPILDPNDSQLINIEHYAIDGYPDECVGDRPEEKSLMQANTLELEDEKSSLDTKTLDEIPASGPVSQLEEEPTMVPYTFELCVSESLLRVPCIADGTPYSSENPSDATKPAPIPQSEHHDEASKMVDTSGPPIFLPSPSLFDGVQYPSGNPTDVFRSVPSPQTETTSITPPHTFEIRDEKSPPLISRLSPDIIDELLQHPIEISNRTPKSDSTMQLERSEEGSETTDLPPYLPSPNPLYDAQYSFGNSSDVTKLVPISQSKPDSRAIKNEMLRLFLSQWYELTVTNVIGSGASEKFDSKTFIFCVTHIGAADNFEAFCPVNSLKGYITITNFSMIPGYSDVFKENSIMVLHYLLPTKGNAKMFVDKIYVMDNPFPLIKYMYTEKFRVKFSFDGKKYVMFFELTESNGDGSLSKGKYQIKGEEEKYPITLSVKENPKLRFAMFHNREINIHLWNNGQWIKVDSFTPSQILNREPNLKNEEIQPRRMEINKGGKKESAGQKKEREKKRKTIANLVDEVNRKKGRKKEEEEEESSTRQKSKRIKKIKPNDLIIEFPNITAKPKKTITKPNSMIINIPRTETTQELINSRSAITYTPEFEDDVLSHTDNSVSFPKEKLLEMLCLTHVTKQMNVLSIDPKTVLWSPRLLELWFLRDMRNENLKGDPILIEIKKKKIILPHVYSYYCEWKFENEQILECWVKSVHLIQNLEYTQSINSFETKLESKWNNVLDLFYERASLLISSSFDLKWHPKAWEMVKDIVEWDIKIFDGPLENVFTNHKVDDKLLNYLGKEVMDKINPVIEELESEWKISNLYLKAIPIEESNSTKLILPDQPEKKKEKWLDICDINELNKYLNSFKKREKN